MSQRETLQIPLGTEVRGFLIERVLGAGGFGTVYRARRGERWYALKFLRCKEAGDWARREVESLLRVSHRNVVGFEGCGFWPDDSREYLVVFMDYVEGRRLDVWAQEENPDARQVARMVLGMARGLAELHRAQVLHRDVKEANTIVRASDGEAVLVDFGVAGGADMVRVTRDVLPPCTLEYRAPEAWRFLRERTRHSGARYQAGPGDDLYALGVVLYWLLTGRWPCVGASEAEQAELTLYHVPEPPHAANPRVPPVLSATCMKLLEKRPEDRYPGAVPLCEALEAALAGADDTWSVPLCEPHTLNNRTTEGSLSGAEVEPADHWVRVARHDHEVPRRGKKPPVPAPPQAERPPSVAAEALPAPAAPPAAEPPPAPVAPPAPPALDVPAPSPVPANREASPGLGRAWRVAAHVALGCALLAGLGGGTLHLAALRSRPSAPSAPPPVIREAEGAEPEFFPGFPGFPETTWEVGWKVAPPWMPPEASGRDFLGLGEAAHAVSATMSEKGEASMKNNPQQKQQKGLGSVGKRLATCAVGAALSCTTPGPPGPQVRSEPPPEECPAAALKAMADLGIDIGEKGDAIINPFEPREYLFVREEWITIEILSGFAHGGRFNAKGRLFFGEGRVYGRFTQLQELNGSRTWPVCLEMLDTDAKPGLPMESGSTADTARIQNPPRVRAVARFP